MKRHHRNWLVRTAIAMAAGFLLALAAAEILAGMLGQWSAG